MADIFSPENIRKAVHANLDAATAAIPPGKKRALLIDATTENGGTVQIVYAQRSESGWNFGIGAAYAGDRVSGKVSVLKTW